MHILSSMENSSGDGRALRDMPEHLRPRELCERVGLENVGSEVLIAILLRTGLTGQNVVDVARTLLERYGSLTALGRASVEELTEYPGIGPVKAQLLKAALEIGRRMVGEAVLERPLIRVPQDAARVMRPIVCGKTHECFWVLLLDSKYRLQREPVEVTKGLIDASLCHAREMFHPAVKALSAAIMLVHNHPSGDPAPSGQDLHMSRKMVEAGRILDIPVLDHVIMGYSPQDESREDYVSIRESGLVAFE